MPPKPQSPAASPPVESRRMVVCAHAGRCESHVDPSRISELLTQPGTFVWLDLQNPQAEDIQLLRDEFQFHPLSIEDATRHHERPKLETFEQYYFMVFYQLNYDDAARRLRSHALGLFIGANYLVSVHHGPITTIDETLTRWQASTAEFNNDAGALIYALLDAIVDDYFPVLDKLADQVEEIEQQIFEHFREEALQSVFSLKRDLLTVRRVVAPERDVLNVLIRREVPIFERNTILYLQDVYDHIVRITDSIDTYRDLLSSALDAFLSLQSNQLNQIVKVLTITSIVLMCDALIAGIYGMNFEFMPELHWRFGYPLALALMVVVSTALLLFFRRRRWL
ncbi:MAG TPA: magnesium/cobalt transporter CorA [Kouleothrix sp.]|uniref:magnesium/cobalt transporter CorA n=1 Tax=Kouleothrix sp. TaxID=2779161 RepID=UPI002CD527D4|nr:magnesium/cobalt transporter CorA [Kouleothrix sp.]HRC75403.1 magnesium/cobalt transporter CorA [Kouleothrix sp.]